MKRSSTFLLATCAAVVLAACGPRKADTTTGGAETGATGATGGAYDTTSPSGTTGDTTSPSGTTGDTTSPSGTMGDTTHAHPDSAAR